MKPEDSMIHVNVMMYVTNVQNLTSQLKDAGQDITEVDIMAKKLG